MMAALTFVVAIEARSFIQYSLSELRCFFAFVLTTLFLALMLQARKQQHLNIEGTF